MANAGEKSSESDAKIRKLDAVFKKAIDVASNGLNNGDLDECFQDIRFQYGNVLPKLYMNVIAKSQVNIEAAYKDICIVHDLEEGMRSYEAPAASSSSPAATKDALESTSAQNPMPEAILLDLKRIEAEHLRDAIQHVDAEIEIMNNHAARLNSQMKNEIEALEEVGNRIFS